MKHESIAVGGVSMILLLYTMFASTGILLNWVAFIFAASPVLIIWMVWVVLKYGEYNGEELEDEQEFGYMDRPELGKQEV
ncbi:hypothetical protein O3Q51_14220 [Cryomorphaceae bacterium 1068]|nr:hypothetical protein [Cryomorphaceae bacterium 1068]